jgi:hypothetical protein
MKKPTAETVVVTKSVKAAESDASHSAALRYSPLRIEEIVVTVVEKNMRAQERFDKIQLMCRPQNKKDCRNGFHANRPASFKSICGLQHAPGIVAGRLTGLVSCTGRSVGCAVGSRWWTYGLTTLGDIYIYICVIYLLGWWSPTQKWLIKMLAIYDFGQPF